MKMDFWEKTDYTDGVPETYTKQLREKKCAIFGFTCPLTVVVAPERAIFFK